MDALSNLTRSSVLPTVSTGVVTVGPDTARTFISDYHYSGQRRLAVGRVDLYRDEMRRGLWRLSELRFARTPDGRTYLINGLTRMEAIIASGTEMPFVVTLVDVADEQEVAAEFATLDQHRIRQTKDLLKGYDLEGRLGLTLSEQERVARTAGIVATGFGSGHNVRFSRTIQFRLSYLLEWADYGRLVVDAMSTGHNLDPAGTRISNAPIFSVAMMTARFQPDKAHEFWRAVAANDGLRRGSAAWIMRDFLARLSTATVREWPGMARRTAACWNGFWEDRPMAFSRVAQTNDGQWAPIRIAGTPYDGRQQIRLYDGGNTIPGQEAAGQRPEDIWARASLPADAANRPTTERERRAGAAR